MVKPTPQQILDTLDAIRAMVKQSQFRDRTHRCGFCDGPGMVGEREMDLREFVGTLPMGHKARQEFAALAEASHV